MILSGEYKPSNIVSFLRENSYPVTEHGEYIKFPALWRGGNNPTSISYYLDKGNAVDWVTSEHFDTKELIKRILGLKTEEEIKLAIEKNNIVVNKQIEPKIKQQRIFDSSILNELLPIYDYWFSRGISEEVLRETKSGVYSNPRGIFRGKYVFPVFNSKNQITFLAGRDIVNKDTNFRWVLRGSKETIFPLFINKDDIIKNKEIILVEGISDVLTFMSCGIRTSVCLFGTECGLSIINFLLKLQDIKIIISTNNDKAGLNSAEKAYKRLSKYFDTRNISIKLPPEDFKDFNDLIMAKGKQSIVEWYKNK